jgi:hypothetical protein
MAGTAAAVRSGLSGAAVGGAFSQAGATQGAAMGAGIAGGLSRAVPVIAGAMAVLGVAEFLGTAIDKASDLNESANAVRVTFGDAADEVAKLGETAASRIGLSQTDFNGLAVRFSNFATTVAGDSRGVADVLSDLTGRAADFASVMNLDVAEASTLFQSGLAGESEPLRRYGIDVSAATVQQTAWRLGIAEAGKELTEQEKVQARYAAIMEQTSKVQGDFANTSGDLANAQRINQARFDDAAAAIGTALLPAATSFAEFTGEKLLPLLERLGPVFEFLEPGITAVVDALLALSGPSIFSELIELIGMLEDGKITADEFREAFEGLPEPVQDAISGIGTFLQQSARNTALWAQSVINAILGPLNALREFMGMTRVAVQLKIPAVLNPFDLPANYRPQSFAYPGAANGAVVDRAGMVRVGEYGPETLFLPEGAEVHPLPASGGVSSLDGVRITGRLDLGNGLTGLIDGRIRTASEDRAMEYRAGGMAGGW